MKTGLRGGLRSSTAQGFPAPVLLAYLTYFTELVAAACLALGLFTRVAALMIWIEMAVIITNFNWKFGYFWTNHGIEYALLLWLQQPGNNANQVHACLSAYGDR
jgi:uncharacterized membrane protein YphA (DoxX/SURF4 family)